MSSDARVGNLLQNEKDDVLNFFLFHMPMAQRRQFMSTLPQHYAILYPDADPVSIGEFVKDSLKHNQEMAKTRAPYERHPL